VFYFVIYIIQVRIFRASVSIAKMDHVGHSPLLSYRHVCPTLCHSKLLVDRHFLKFHGSFFVLFILLEAAGSASPVLLLYLIVFAY
jgi:hypothetical protein